MKKIFTLISTLCVGASMFADVVFTNTEGTATYGNGQTMIIFSEEEEGDYYLEAPMIKNNGEACDVHLEYNIDRLPAGTSVLDCFGGLCKMRSEAAAYETIEIEMGAGESVTTQIEWNCFGAEDYVSDYCQITFNVFEGETKGATITVQYVNTGVKRQRHLVEEITSTGCLNCPQGALAVNALYHNHEDSIAVACIHVNFSGVDPMRTAETTALANYLGASSYPTVALDRNYQVEESAVAVPFATGNVESDAKILYDDLKMKSNPSSFVPVDITAEVVEGKVKVNVSGTGMTDAKIMLEKYSLTVYALEDGIVAAQKNGSSTDEEYVHNHVVRKVLTAINGDAINWTAGNTYANSYELTLEEGWVAEKMSVLAFISRKEDLQNPRPKFMSVNNANLCALAGTSAIETLAVASPAAEGKISLRNGKFEIVRSGKSFDLLGR